MAPDSLPIALVLSTEADTDRAERLARRLVEAGLAACVSLRPLRSIYRWRGEIEQGEEVELLIKTRPDQLEPLRRLLHDHHSYETPEWIHWIAEGEGAYAGWIQALGGAAGPGGLSPAAGPPAPADHPGGEDPAG